MADKARDERMAMKYLLRSTVVPIRLYIHKRVGNRVNSSRYTAIDVFTGFHLYLYRLQLVLQNSCMNQRKKKHASGNANAKRGC